MPNEPQGREFLAHTLSGAGCSAKFSTRKIEGIWMLQSARAECRLGWPDDDRQECMASDEVGEIVPKALLVRWE